MLENNLNLLREAADAAGQIARTFFKKNPKVWYKDADQSPVTEADVTINEMLINKLKSARPEYGWLSEETEDDEKRLLKDYVFIVDPIDGTRSFIDEHENYACALGIAYKGKRSIYFIIENNDKILGGAGINPLRDSEEFICELQKMYFTETARGKGWGEKMIDKCLTYAIDKGYKFCYIETMDFMKAAQKLYLKKGFDFISKPMGNTGHTNCNVWMIKKLK